MLYRRLISSLESMRLYMRTSSILPAKFVAGEPDIRPISRFSFGPSSSAPLAVCSSVSDLEIALIYIIGTLVTKEPSYVTHRCCHVPNVKVLGAALHSPGCVTLP